MKQLKHTSLWAGSAYFLVLLGIALWVRDIPNQLDAYNLTLPQLITASQFGDPKYFAKAAIDIAANGWIGSANEWIFNIWPPGFALLEAIIIKMLGSAVPVILVLQVLATVLFSVVLVLLYDLVSTCVKSRFAFLLPLLIFAFPVSRVFLLEPTGISFGESFAIGFFLLGILLSFRSLVQNSLRYAAYAGLCLALSAYFRSQFEIILLVMSVWAGLLIILTRLMRSHKTIDPRVTKLTLKIMAVVLLVAHAATIPWRAYHWIHQGSPAWVLTSNLVFANSVKTSEQLNNDNAGFVVVGGGNLVCRIDPTTCGDTANAEKLFVKTLTSHPVRWYMLKSSIVGQYWFSSVQNWTNINAESSMADMLTNGLLLISLIVMVALLLTHKVRSHGSWTLLLWFNASLFSAYWLIFTLIHFEARYFYFPKIAGIVMSLIVASLYFRPVSKIDILNKEEVN